MMVMIQSLTWLTADKAIRFQLEDFNKLQDELGKEEMKQMNSRHIGSCGSTAPVSQNLWPGSGTPGQCRDAAGGFWSRSLGWTETGNQQNMINNRSEWLNCWLTVLNNSSLPWVHLGRLHLQQTNNIQLKLKDLKHESTQINLYLYGAFQKSISEYLRNLQTTAENEKQQNKIKTRKSKEHNPPTPTDMHRDIHTHTHTHTRTQTHRHTHSHSHIQ